MDQIISMLGSTLATALTPAPSAPAWNPRFADESLIEWLIVICYFATAILCLRARRVALIGRTESGNYTGPARRRWDRADAYAACARFWALLFGLFLFLGVNKRLDLQSYLTYIARAASRDQGWYESRRLVQGAIIGLIIIVGLAGFSALLWYSRRMMPRLAVAFFGTALLAAFLMSKASSYHHLDTVLYFDVRGVRVYQPLELSGILCVAVCAVMNCWWHDFRTLASRLARRLAHP